MFLDPEEEKKAWSERDIFKYKMHFFRMRNNLFFIYNICGYWTLQALTEANCEGVCQLISRLTKQGKDPYCTNSHTSITFALSQNKYLDMGTSVQKFTKEKKLESQPHMYTDENGPMNADKKGRRYVGS